MCNQEHELMKTHQGEAGEGGEQGEAGGRLQGGHGLSSHSDVKHGLKSDSDSIMV